MPMLFIIFALPISKAKGLKFDLKRDVTYEIYELLPSSLRSRRYLGGRARVRKYK